jgi:tripartite-type tricarboxylate transporter receptor subunit TctC
MAPIIFAIATLLTAIFAFASQSLAQQYPDRPVRIVVGFAAGSGPDIQARTVGQQLAMDLGQQFYVENKLGANGTIAARSVATAAPDGHTLLFSSSSIAPTPYIYKNAGYDLLNDLRPIATVGELDGIFMLVNAASPVKTVPEFIKYAKQNNVAYGSPGVGNELHLKAELFKRMAGIEMQHIPYKGASEVITALLSGAVQVMFVTPPSVIGLIQEGRVRPLAFTGSKPFAAFPDVPLMKQYLPDYVQGSWGMFFAPGKTPDALVNQLNTAIHTALRQPSVAAIMRNAAETAAFFRQKVEECDDLVKAADIQSN